MEPGGPREFGGGMPLAQVPIYQKEIIKQANQKKRLAITTNLLKIVKAVR